MNNRIAWIAALAFAAFGSAAEAQTITAVYTTYSATGVPTKLDITGTAFCTASTCATKPPVVRLGGNIVAISGASPTGIGIPLTGVFADGDYMLSVTPPGKSAINYAFTLKSKTGGATGPQGPMGPQGPKGDTGSPGLPGMPGQQGPAGPKGDTGATGVNGSAGAPGAKGDKGDRGDKGDTGPSGPMGLQGPAGIDGLMGPQGPVGPQGPKGDAGENGNLSLSGISCPSGTFLKGFKSDSSADCVKFISAVSPQIGASIGIDYPYRGCLGEPNTGMVVAGWAQSYLEFDLAGIDDDGASYYLALSPSSLFSGVPVPQLVEVQVFEGTAQKSCQESQWNITGKKVGTFAVTDPNEFEFHGWYQQLPVRSGNAGDIYVNVTGAVATMKSYFRNWSGQRFGVIGFRLFVPPGASSGAIIFGSARLEVRRAN